MARHPLTLDATIDVVVGEFRLDISLAVDAGTTIAVVGPNGAGKTTLLRTLAGLWPLTNGTITIDGRVVDDPARDVFVPAERRPVAVVFQEQLLFPHLDALENVAFGLRARGVPRAEARRRAREWLERVQLGDRAGALPVELSGGQGQRVALARALAISPSLLLLDEPLAALDASTRIEVRRELRAHLETFDGARVVVTHDAVDAATLADEIIVLEHGTVTQRGAPASLTARPRSRWVANLVGTNLLHGTGAGHEVHLDAGGTIVCAERAPDGPVLAVIAPRAIALHRLRPEGTPRNVWPASVTHVEPAVDAVRVQLAGPPDVVAEVTNESRRELAIAEGVPLWISVKATEVQVFPA